MPDTVKVKLINVLDLSRKDEVLLRALIEQTWRDDRKESVPKFSRRDNPHRVFFEGQEYDLRLSHSLIKSLDKDNEYEIVEHQKLLTQKDFEYFYSILKRNPSRDDVVVGKGQFGRVKKALKSLVLTDDGKVEVLEREYVVKLQKIPKQQLERQKLEEAITKDVYPETKPSIYLPAQKDEQTVLTFMPDFGMELEKFHQEQKFLVLEPVEKFKIIENLLTQLQHLKDKGIVHRDIKPQNILIDPVTLETKIIDFGSAAYKAKPPTQASIAGSLPYMSDAHFNGQLIHEMDMHSMMVVVMRLLTNKTYNPVYSEQPVLDIVKQMKGQEFISKTNFLALCNEPRAPLAKANNAIYDLTKQFLKPTVTADLTPESYLAALRKLAQTQFNINLAEVPQQKRAPRPASKSEEEFREALKGVKETFKQQKRDEKMEAARKKIASIIKEVGLDKTKEYFANMLQRENLLPSQFLNYILQQYCKSESAYPKVITFLQFKKHHHLDDVRKILNENKEGLTLDKFVNELIDSTTQINQKGTLAEIIKVFAQFEGKNENYLEEVLDQKTKETIEPKKT